MKNWVHLFEKNGKKALVVLNTEYESVTSIVIQWKTEDGYHLELTIDFKHHNPNQETMDKIQEYFDQISPENVFNMIEEQERKLNL